LNMDRPVLENFNIVLVRTLYAGNIGSAARAMMNMGIRDLRLVSPDEVKTEECRFLAVNAWEIVEKAPIFDSLEEAVSGSSLVVGTTCQRGRRSRVREYTPREIAPLLLEKTPRGEVSIVFGPERGGLTEKELASCQYLVNIPASPELPTLNLSQAVLVICYELFSCGISAGISPDSESDLPSQRERDQMFGQIESTLVEIGFLSSSNPGHIMKSVRRMLGGQNLTRRDVQIMRGIMSRIDWYLESGKYLPSEKVRKP